VLKKTHGAKPDSRGIWTDEYDTPLASAPPSMRNKNFSKRHSGTNWTSTIERVRKGRGGDAGQRRRRMLRPGRARTTGFVPLIKATGALPSLIVDPPMAGFRRRDTQGSEKEAAERSGN